MSIIPLSRLEKNACALIHAIMPNTIFGELDPQVSRRLTDLGFSDGMSLTVIGKGLLGKGPYIVRLGNQSQFALPEPEASKILCQVAV
ncbi:MAG TPA: ferrous iron transport protein A [Pasteurellaceae bacterium]|nr:ferrous iron transport protein A [Pasteurellaceae bacterium]